MTKLATLLFAVCIVVLFAASISAAPSITMEFVGEFRAGRPAIVRVTTTDMDLTNIIKIDAKKPVAADEGKTYWDTSYIVSGTNTVSNMNQDVLKQNNFLTPINYLVYCVDEVTHRPIAYLSFNSSTMTLRALNSVQHKTNFPSGSFGSFNFLCPMSIETTKAYAPQLITLVATQNNVIDPIEFPLIPPAAWSWRQPLITINSASYSANTRNLLGGKVRFQFSTDTAGIHRVSVRNGPQPVYYNRVNQEFTSYQCGENVEAYIIATYTGLQIHVKDSAANGVPVTCTVDVDGYMSSAFTERSQVVIEMDTVLVAQGIDFPVLDATFTAQVVSLSGKEATFSLDVNNLNFSSSPLHTNSTVEIRFSGVDVYSLKPTKTEYRKDVVCPALGGTFSQDGKSVFIKDVSKVLNTFLCTFDFVGTKIVRLDEFTPVPTIQVLVDGVSLYNRAVRSTTFPLYLPFNVEIAEQQIQIYQDDSIIKHVVEFSIADASYGVVPQKPILVLSYNSPATWPTASYADMLSCEVTSPSSSVYEPLITTFDIPRRVWTADLSSLIDTDTYKVKFRCIRSEAVVEKFDIVQNTANQLIVSFLDVVSGKGYIYISTPFTLQEQSPKAYLKRPINPQIPTEFTQYFSFSTSFYITDFTTMTSVADDVSTKVIAAIKAGYDAYDATLPLTPTKLSPKLINKTEIGLNYVNINSDEYSPTFGEKMYNLYHTIIGHQFQQYSIKSAPSYGPVFSTTSHQQSSTPKVSYFRFFTSGSNYAEIQALTSTANKFASDEIGNIFYKDAYSTSPTIDIPLVFDFNGFQFPSPTQKWVMNPIDSCGYYEVGYSAFVTGSPIDSPTSYDYKFDYDRMTPSNTNRITNRFTCRFAEVCSADADCDSGYCSQGICASMRPSFKYPYVKYDSVEDLSEYNGYNNSVVASLSAACIAVIVALLVYV